MDKAGEGYWSSVWESNPDDSPFDPLDNDLDNHVASRFHDYFSELFKESATRESRLLEVGCAHSSWLPYFAKQHGFRVSGIDYSEVGCRQARRMLERGGVVGEIVCADFFSPPPSMFRQYDVVLSMGVVEHFEDSVQCLKALARFLKPGGMLITTIPNLRGTIGLIQFLVNRPVFDIHMPLRKKDLQESHKRSELEVCSCEYFLFTNFGVCNLQGLAGPPVTMKLKQGLLIWLGRLSKVIWLCERHLHRQLPPNAVTSPYVICVARKA